MHVWMCGSLDLIHNCRTVLIVDIVTIVLANTSVRLDSHEVQFTTENQSIRRMLDSRASISRAPTVLMDFPVPSYSHFHHRLTTILLSRFMLNLQTPVDTTLDELESFVSDIDFEIRRSFGGTVAFGEEDTQNWDSVDSL